MIEPLITDLIGFVRYWAVLLLMAPIAYVIGKQVYEAGNGWIKILGSDDFAKKLIAVVALAIALPLATIFAGQIQDVLHTHLPSGMWLLPYFGVGLLGLLWMVNDIANMNLRDGNTSTRLLIATSLLLIITPVIVRKITATYDLGRIWQQIVVQPFMQNIVVPIRTNLPLIVLIAVITGYGYSQYRSD